MIPVLYILMRTDMPSMNAGKAMAQASHASNAFIHRMDNRGSPHAQINDMRHAWTNETNQGFGTVLVLAANGSQIKSLLEKAKAYASETITDEVVDPTYPYQVTGEIANLLEPETPIYRGDSMVTLYRSEVTCAYIFGDKDGAAGSLVSELKLHP